jgi:hypothetical protein
MQRLPSRIMAIRQIGSNLLLYSVFDARGYSREKRHCDALMAQIGVAGERVPVEALGGALSRSARHMGPRRSARVLSPLPGGTSRCVKP